MKKILLPTLLAFLLSCSDSETPDFPPYEGISSSSSEKPIRSSSSEKSISSSSSKEPDVPSAADSLPPSGHYASGLAFTLPSSVYCDKTGKLPTVSSAMQPGSAQTLTQTTILRCEQLLNISRPVTQVMRTYIIGRLPDLPIVSIAADPAEFSSKYNTRTGDYDIPIHVDFFERGASHAWSYPAELSPMGNASREFPKKSVAVSFKEKYGQKNIKYPLFPSHPNLTKFKHFILRNNGNNYQNDYIRDMLMTSLTEGLDIDYQKGRAAVVYYNGEYWGIHNLRERSNSDYYETNYNYNEDYIDLVKYIDGGREVSRGSDEDYQTNVIGWLESGVSLANEANMEILEERIDVDNFTNHFQSRIFYNDRDWPGNNIKMWRSTSPRTKWRFFMYDTDHGFGSWGTGACQNLTTLAFVTTESVGCARVGWPNPAYSTLILRKLLENQNYKNAFINRFSLLIATYFESSRVNARIDALMADINSETQYDQSRWPNRPWSRPLSTIVNFANSRPNIMQSEIQSHFGLKAPVNITITGYTHVDGLPIPSFAGSSVTFKAYPGVPMKLKWSGGERTIDVATDGATFTAGQ